MLTCAVCGGNEFISHKVLWPELIDRWQLSPYEIEYIDRQQGQCCCVCGSNLRSIAIAKAIVDSYDYPGTLSEFVQSEYAVDLKVLEINEAGKLSRILKLIPNHQLAVYPLCDIMNMKYDDNTWDLVIHSDTLEHIEDPVLALSECRRILGPNGKCIFTVPIIIDRLSRSRAGLPESYHGSPSTSDKALLVHTEFGMDFWKYIFKAGFSRCHIHCLDYPAAFAIEASG